MKLIRHFSWEKMKFIWYISFIIGILNRCSATLNITVDPNGTDDDGCLNGSHPCKTIDYAFKHAHLNETQYVLRTGNYSANSYLFRDLYGMSIIGRGGNVVVTCKVDNGLSFINVHDIEVHSVSFVGCGMRVCDVSGTFCPPSDQLRAGLYFYMCSNVSMSNVTVQNSSNAIGVVFHDTIGTNNVTNCVFQYNGVPLDPISSTSSSPSGARGGLSVMLSYCTPGDICTSTSNANSTYNIYLSKFTANVGGGLVFHLNSPLFQYEGGTRGGGLSLIFGGNSSNNTVTVRGCLLNDNIALDSGSGGMSVDFLDNSAGNTVQVLFSELVHNGGQDVVGGGLAVRYMSSIIGNKVVVNRSTFLDNDGITGGALAILTLMPHCETLHKNVPFQLVSSKLKYNRAQLGSAIYALSIPSRVEGVTPTILIEGTNMIIGNMQTQNFEPYVAGLGAVYTSGVPIDFNGNVVFKTNGRSALAILGTSVDFCLCNATFDSNSRTARGGAIIILNGGWINICNSTFVNFTQNIADVDGGAIYNYYNQIIHSSCFFRYTDPAVLPSSWMSYFLFSKNHATYGGNSIHSSSLLPCSFGSTNIREIFCWDEEHWNYSGYPCQHEIASDASNVKINMSAGALTTAYQGQVVSLPIEVTDARGNNVLNKTAFHATISNSTIAFLSKELSNVANGSLQIFANSTAGNITLELNEVGITPGWHVEVSVTMQDCPPGLAFYHGTGSCGCSMDDYGSTILCLSIDSDSIAAFIQKNNWMGQSPGYDTLVTSACPPGYCIGSSTAKVVQGFIQLPLSVDNLNDQICSDGRTGVLCGECKPNYKPAINSLTYQCVLCDNNVSMTNNRVLYIALAYLPALVIFIVSALIGNYVIAGPASAMILFSQLVASTYDLTASGAIDVNGIFAQSGLKLVEFYRLLYGMVNLDGLLIAVDPFCISSSLDILGIILLQYVLSITPLLAIIPFLIAYVMCSKHALCEHFTAHRHPIKVFAVYLLLTYNKICITTSEAFNLASLKDKNGKRVGGFRMFFAGQYEISELAYQSRVVIAYFSLLLIIAVPIVLVATRNCDNKACKSSEKTKNEASQKNSGGKVQPTASKNTPPLISSAENGGGNVQTTASENARLLVTSTDRTKTTESGGGNIQTTVSDKNSACSTKITENGDKRSDASKPKIRPDVMHTLEMFSGAFFSGYKSNRKWFSAAYFVVRLAVNFVYIIAEPGGFVLMVQLLVYVLMLVTIIIAQPYEEIYLNYWDMFVFGCLIALGAASQYILYAAHLTYQRFWIQTFFCLQIIILCIVPIIWIIFLVWRHRNTKEPEEPNPEEPNPEEPNPKCTEVSNQ